MLNYLKNKTFYHYFMFLYIILAIVSFFINHILYKGVVDSTIIIVCLTVFFSNILKKQYSKKFLIPNIIILSILGIIFISILPKYTYNKAVSKIKYEFEKKGQEILMLNSDTYSIQCTEKANLFIKNYYLIKSKIDKEVVYYCFNPSNGKYYIKNP